MDDVLTFDENMETATFTIPSNVDEAKKLYDRYAVVRYAVDTELHARQEHIHEVEPRSSHYAVMGMLHELAGEEFEVDIREAVDHD